jgi:hypothetical protein
VESLVDPQIGLIRIAGTAAGQLYDNNQWVGKIGTSRLTSAVTLAAKGDDPNAALRSSPTVGEFAIVLRAALGAQADNIGSQFDRAMFIAQAAQNNIQNTRLLASFSGPTSKPAAGSLNTVLAPTNALDAASQAALINAVAQSVRGGSVVLVPQDRTQTLLLQQEFNRQGVATQVAQTPQAGITLAKQTGASWVIGTDGRWADPPFVQPSRTPLKPPDTLPSCLGCGGPLPPPPGRGGGGPPPPPPPPPALSSGPANWSGFQRFTPPASQNTPGGVRTFKDALIDDGRWPVHVPLTLCLPVVLTAAAGNSSEAR